MRVTERHLESQYTRTNHHNTQFALFVQQMNFEGLWEDPFHMYPRLLEMPAELRQMVCSKMPLIDRWAMARASQEAAQYFQRFRVTVDDVHIMGCHRDGIAVVVVSYGDYEEKFELSDQLIPDLRGEQTGDPKCLCDHCRRRIMRAVEAVKNPNQPLIETRHLFCNHWDNVLHTLRNIARTNTLHIHTAEYGGLVECLPPSGTLSQPTNMEFEVYKSWKRPRRGVVYKRKCLEKWSRWLEFARPPEVSLLCTHGKTTSLFNELAELPTLRNVPIIRIEGLTSIDVNQLLKLNCEKLFISIGTLSEADCITFYKSKIEMWLENPGAKFCAVEMRRRQGRSKVVHFRRNSLLFEKLNLRALLSDHGRPLREFYNFDLFSDQLETTNYHKEMLAETSNVCLSISNFTDKSAVCIYPRGIMIAPTAVHWPDY